LSISSSSSSEFRSAYDCLALAERPLRRRSTSAADEDGADEDGAAAFFGLDGTLAFAVFFGAAALGSLGSLGSFGGPGLACTLALLGGGRAPWTAG